MRPYRVLQGLRTATCCERPAFIPVAKRLKGAKRLGVAYEKKVGKFLSRVFLTVYSGVWFEFVDASGRGWCQADHYVVLERHVLLIECKLSERDEAWSQMRRLYAPILELIYKRPVTCVQACRFLKSNNKLIQELQDARPGGDFLWHFLA